jgi:hypothetical protein
MMKFTIACVAVAAFAAPAFADQPNGVLWPFKDNTDYTKIDNLEQIPVIWIHSRHV